ncbi:MAG: polysaccharide deacetylase family protein, partial [Candidatus Thorarchaeota archaeon]
MKIALTIDIERDIPFVLDSFFGVIEGIPRILELLDCYNLKCTFFCTGNIAKKFPESIRTIESKGHEIACHGLTHERLNKLEFDKCQDVISKNKEILEKICLSSKIIGFRAPYLKPPDFLFKILYNLGFHYDSSFKSNRKNSLNISNPYSIREFQPLDISLRMPFGYNILKRKVLKNDLVVLYFHPSEIIDIKNLMVTHKSRL